MTAELSLLQTLRTLPQETQDYFHAKASEALKIASFNSWDVHRRPSQSTPQGNWRMWLILAGRGWGKTRTGAEFVRQQIDLGMTSHIALVGPTAADVRDTMIEGESGLLGVYSADQRPRYEPSKRRVTFHNGAVASAFSADEPDRLRGPNHDLAWADELAAWRYPEAACCCNNDAETNSYYSATVEN